MKTPELNVIPTSVSAEVQGARVSVEIRESGEVELRMRYKGPAPAPTATFGDEVIDTPHEDCERTLTFASLKQFVWWSRALGFCVERFADETRAGARGARGDE